MRLRVPHSLASVGICGWVDQQRTTTPCWKLSILTGIEMKVEWAARCFTPATCSMSIPGGLTRAFSGWLSGRIQEYGGSGFNRSRASGVIFCLSEMTLTWM